MNISNVSANIPAGHVKVTPKAAGKELSSTVKTPVGEQKTEKGPEDQVSLQYDFAASKTKDVEVLNLPKDVPPFGTAEMYKPVLHLSGKKGVIPGYPGEQLAPVKFNFDGDWNILDNTADYRKDFFGNEKVGEVAKWMGTSYCHTVDTEVNGEKYRVYQYWHYYAENPLLVDQHEHDWENVQVYVKENGQPKWVFTSAHFTYHQYGTQSKEQDAKKNNGMVGFEAGEVKWEGTHPKVYVAQNGHAMVADTKNFLPYDRCFEPYSYKGTMTHLVDMDNPKAEDNPFPNLKDKYGLIDDKGYLKNNGTAHNWFVRVKDPITRKSFTEGAFGHAAHIHTSNKNEYQKHLLQILQEH